LAGKKAGLQKSHFYFDHVNRLYMYKNNNKIFKLELGGGKDAVWKGTSPLPLPL